MVKIIFVENEDGIAKYHSHEGDLNFKLDEVLMNENSCLDDMIVYLFCDVYSDKWSVDEAFEKFDALDYEPDWFEEKLSKRSVTYAVRGE